jgi:hypothetical protein
MRWESRNWTCEVCGQAVSRLLGMAGVVQLPDGRTQVHPTVRGYCAAHRGVVSAAFRTELAQAGSVIWVGEPNAELRPRQADAWLEELDLGLGTSLAPNRGYVVSGATAPIAVARWLGTREHTYAKQPNDSVESPGSVGTAVRPVWPICATDPRRVEGRNHPPAGAVSVVHRFCRSIGFLQILCT